MRYAIVTGASKGLGKEVAKLLLSHGIHVIGISRSTTLDLNANAAANEVTYQGIAYDLGNVEKLEELMETIVTDLINDDVSGLYLVNNAAVIEPIDQGVNISPASLAYHFQVNAVAPMALTNLCLQYANKKGIPMVGLTVTSGAAEKPMFGWTAYCSSKASINMYIKTIAKEQDSANHKIIAFSPGIMDTEMQEKIRSSEKSAFQAVDTFKAYQENNQLQQTEEIARIAVRIMLQDDAENGKIYYARDYL
ncbi:MULTISPECIES: SDR family NAD(P)-dependent oxidoreductase [unclassified Virgibacillus]|uniref:SDR family NAD(P)-dependent oxidoreductase n=1 Tax=unclassified Virgibacillus TaxID=2620237 RepID=UPI000909949F|nr:MULTISPECIES: SDR family NAD(P)-dependent oxidoreductase [unclassified Virgibacillus]API91116.1 short-chain dehydrogenase [Virgibacillus sp. 6R]MBS7429105.1 SDR family NAD(P)-dependent oxidoreductase [Virgibacillus sp. 19R1-5]